MIVLGIDPGLANTGWGVIETRGSVARARAYGCIHSEASEPLHERLARSWRQSSSVTSPRPSPSRTSSSGRTRALPSSRPTLVARPSWRARRPALRSRRTRPCRSSSPSWARAPRISARSRTWCATSSRSTMIQSQTIARTPWPPRCATPTSPARSRHLPRRAGRPRAGSPPRAPASRRLRNTIEGWAHDRPANRHLG